jgi:hypothetical protein
MADNKARRKAAQNIKKDLSGRDYDPKECVWLETPGEFMTYTGEGKEKWHGKPQRWLDAGEDLVTSTRGEAATREQRLILIDQLDAIYVALDELSGESSVEKQALYEQAEDIETQLKLMRGTAPPNIRTRRGGRGGRVPPSTASTAKAKKKAFVPPLAGGSAADARELYRKRYGVDPPTHRE